MKCNLMVVSSKFVELSFSQAVHNGVRTVFIALRSWSHATRRLSDRLLAFLINIHPALHPAHYWRLHARISQPGGRTDSRMAGSLPLANEKMNGPTEKKENLAFEVSFDFCAFEVEGKPLAARGAGRGGTTDRVWVWNPGPAA
jgi:hypothetical protein